MSEKRTKWDEACIEFEKRKAQYEAEMNQPEPYPHDNPMRWLMFFAGRGERPAGMPPTRDTLRGMIR